MTKILEKFLKNIKKLDNYYILKEHSDYLIVGTQIEVIENKEINTNVFMHFTKKVKKKIYTAFILVLNSSNELEKYANKKIPTLIISSDVKLLKLSSLKEYLDNYINELLNNGV